MVCPRIEGDEPEDDAEPDPVTTTPAARLRTMSSDDACSRRPSRPWSEVAERLRALPALAGMRIGVMHGRLSGDHKDAAMAAFADGTTPVLVSTTVIEVGVDVPQASTMVVLDADHFGVSQLHQLRGRVGRASEPGLCLLVTRAQEGTPSLERLDAVAVHQRRLRARGEGPGAAARGRRAGRGPVRRTQLAAIAARGARRRVLATARDDARGWSTPTASLASVPALARAIEEWLGEREEFLERT